jgi:hypothetical protein
MKIEVCFAGLENEQCYYENNELQYLYPQPGPRGRLPPARIQVRQTKLPYIVVSETSTS